MPPASKPESTEIELTSFALPGNVTTRMGETSIIVGNHFNTGMGIGEVVERITFVGPGTVMAHMGEHRVLMFSTGAMAVVK